MKRTHQAVTGPGSAIVTCHYEVREDWIEMTDVTLSGVSLAGVLSDDQWNELAMDCEYAWKELNDACAYDKGEEIAWRLAA